MTETDRRSVLLGAAAAGAALPVLAACGNSPQSSRGPGSSETTPAGPSGTKLVATGDVPVGGGVILTKDEVVVTQPEAGTFKGFSAVCTHQGCLIGLVDQGRLICPCHGSQYSIDDGRVLAGPAQRPLPEVSVTVKDGEVEVA